MHNRTEHDARNIELLFNRALSFIRSGTGISSDDVNMVLGLMPIMVWLRR